MELAVGVGWRGG